MEAFWSKPRQLHCTLAKVGHGSGIILLAQFAEKLELGIPPLTNFRGKSLGIKEAERNRKQRTCDVKELMFAAVYKGLRFAAEHTYKA